VRYEQDKLNCARRELPPDASEHGRKNGSEKTRELSSHTTNAIDPVRRGAAERGARLRA
jgi:hypothetical protein